MGFEINSSTSIVVEECGLAGVKRVAGCLASDMEKVFGNSIEVITDSKTVMVDQIGKGCIFAATIGYSEIVKNMDLSDIQGKREVYKIIQVGENLGIIGSDKRGTIYGLFHLSELLGVSVFVDWFKINPARKDSFTVTEEMMITSKEPSVRYRGFFINDEWPAFGNWCNKNFGGFNKKAYEQIFLLLLRMKGNYMWPAMWTAIFPDDGPGLGNEELADELGVVMGMSHHEPCLRQGEEYKYLRGKDSIYGDAWNFRTNEAGITKFWEDGLIRSGRFENVITVGMRGEYDSAIMGKDATLKDNIDLLRDVLVTQNRLIRENVNENLEEVPRMLALYKEVEPYFYGDDTTEGLMDSPELEGVTLMLCDDNYGNLRTVPTQHMRDHKGGYGMYYHFDYHGFPISFEWINSSYLPKVWEQMCTAYEFGIRDLWIVNVGDLFTMEYPLSYFLSLAYDFDKWGTSNINSAREYTRLFVEKSFADRCSKDAMDKMYDLLLGYTKIAHKRRPEAMNCDVYSPVWYGETKELLEEIDFLEHMTDELMEEVDEDLKNPLFYLMTYPLKGNLNVQKIQLLTGLNHYYSQIGCTKANALANEIDDLLGKDVALVDELHEKDNGRFYGMGLSEHIGFVHWNEEECLYPIVHRFKPGNKPRIIVSIPGTDQHSEGGDWTRKTLSLGDFLIPDTKEAFIELASAGAQGKYSISVNVPYLTVEDCEGIIDQEEIKSIKVLFDKEKYIDDVKAQIVVKTEVGRIDINVPVNVKTSSELAKEYQVGTFIWLGEENSETNIYCPLQYISMEAKGYSELIDVKMEEGKEAGFREIPGYGKTLSAMKAFPADVTFEEGKAPEITYSFETKRDGKYVIEAYMNPSNAPFRDGHLYFGMKVNDGKTVKIDALPEGFKVGDDQMDWLKGVLDNIRIAGAAFELKKGINTVSFMALSPGFVLEKVVLYEEGREPGRSYLGPKQTYRV